ncbi:DUF554 domain-containing protein [Sanyastnella coralliicola]|uniref:DUF554 domain-containing protein n=1 Tax=Sanyastnella coralliicola TaxID=3069118 RepID=UPI0027B93DE5|nr:DUF554 domain-containing protein [Longitalea sp. SCSIO 12813]
MLGTLFNVVTVAVGASSGLLLKDKLPERYTSIIFVALGLCTLFFGVDMGLGSNNPLVLILSLVFGAILGESLKLESRSLALTERFKKGGEDDNDKGFAEGLLTAFVLFCIGSMTLLGCLTEGLEGDRTIIMTKATMDLFSSAALAAAFGRGVLFSIIPLFIYQGGLTLGAEWISPLLNETITAEIFGCGGILLIGLGLNILQVTKIKMLNLAPALFICPLFAWLLPVLEALLNAILT